MRATSGSTSSRMSASVTMLPVRFDMRTSRAVLHHLHELAEDDLGLARREAERLHARLQRLHLAVVVGAPDVDEVREAAAELVAVVREVVAEIGRAAVAAHEHAVALVAEIGGAQPARAVVARRRSPSRSSCSSTSTTSPRSCSVRSENQVSKCTPTRAEVVVQALHDAAVAPLARVVGRDVVAELGVQLAPPCRRGTGPGSRPRAARSPR